MLIACFGVCLILSDLVVSFVSTLGGVISSATLGDAAPPLEVVSRRDDRMDESCRMALLILLSVKGIPLDVSELLIEAIESKGLDYQLASPYDHRLNPAKQQVQTFKNHLISNLHGCDTSFPAYKWCSIIRQCEMTLNMLRRSRINPKLSAYTQLFGMFDYNQTPLAPLGTKAFVHERPNQRRTHADHGKIAYVI